MILLIDNYDSFTYNLFQYLCELGEKVRVERNDKVSLADIRRMRPAKIVISPGPGTPDEAGVSLGVVKTFSGDVPILGVCLGHQSIGQAFGGKIVRAPRLMHGKTSEISHNVKGLFRGVKNPFTATRYHSLVVSKRGFPADLEITAHADGLLMGLRHKRLPVAGVQFHPESVMTTEGKKILKNFLEGRI